jgi:hypothetical protein
MGFARADAPLRKKPERADVLGEDRPRVVLGTASARLPTPTVP